MIFTTFNFRIMQNQLDMSVSISMEVARLASDACCTSNEIVQLMASDYEEGHLKISELML